MIPRTDRNNNPAAFTTQIAAQAGLKKGVEYEDGDPFPAPSKLVTARLLGDPIELTIRVIDKIGYVTSAGVPRWTYINIPKFVWSMLPYEVKRDIVGLHYKNEGGSAMKVLFPNYDKV